MEIYNTFGTCSRQIIFRVDDEERVTNVKFVGGCSGNLQGISRLVNGKTIDEIVPMLKGIICRSNTSCPDQLAKALLAYREKKNGNVQ
ncbi:MAG: TIGR03905 family TSCPD domain-containing protein [Clostridia bacterium]|nr:TIGR03905 family TSCPD domain-containing protein [Clostridia bacterium]